ncbi:MAG: class I SAM-dependent methyltransferase [Mucilaginibacter sp.]|uniref:class I SAM-dependent methyltransferase n=1 Tax=Mucilaginibacter sp. TaxID=1882438 RepID=UPI00319F3DC8
MKESRTDMPPATHQSSEEVLEEMYIAIREKEGRIYTDKQVAQLPLIDKGHRFYKEWVIRERSSQRLINYLAAMRKPLNILEIGCGNGWLSAKLAAIPNAKVTGLDPNRVEIEQARRVFKKSNLQFVQKGFDGQVFDENVKFDLIIFAASVQYFASVREVMANAFALLTKGGKVHILDTPFYNKQQADVAAKRCREYYQDMGFEAMADHYFHHTLNKMSAFKHKILFDPRGLWNRIIKKDVFYWIVLKP